MKKIIYSLLISCFIGVAVADVDFSQAIKNTSMPTDSEIRATISQFDFTPEQQEAIFKDTKKKLQEMYSSQNMNQTNAQLNQYLNQIESGSLDKYIDPSTKKELLQTVYTLPKTTSDSSSSIEANVSSGQNSSSVQHKGFQHKGYRHQGYQHKGFQSKKQSN